jgi:hypothetical protein
MNRLPGLAWLRDVRWPIASAVLDGEAVADDGSEGICGIGLLGFLGRSTSEYG